MSIYIELSSVDGFISTSQLSAFAAAVEAANNYEGDAMVEIVTNGLRCDIAPKVED